MRPLCTRVKCADPACRLTHLTSCVFCGDSLPEEEAVETRAGLAHEDCADKRYTFDYGDSVYPR